MSKTTEKVLSVITDWFKQYHYPPTVRELADKCGFSSTWPVRYHLGKLAELGHIRLNKKISRGIELITQITGIPIIGKVSAGKPVDATENFEGYVDLAGMFKNRDELFALKIKGDSMAGAGIFENDIVFVKKQEQATNGDIVVAMIGDEALVKKYYLRKSGINLEPANPKYETIITKETKILGKVIAVFRNY
jgi:repressor LexA